MHGTLHASRRVVVAMAAAALTLTPLIAPSPVAAATSAQCTTLVAPTPVAVNGVRFRIAQMTDCSPTSATGGAGTSVTNLSTLVNTTTWAGGMGKTIVKSSYKAGATPNNCPSGTHLTISGGTVIGGSGPALSVIKVGQAVSARWCVTAKFAVTLEPGSVHKFNASSVTPAVPPPPPPVKLSAALKDCPAGAERDITAALNRDRRTHGNLPPLKESANLDWAARKHSIAMGVKQTSFHDGWDTEIRDSRFQASPPYWLGQSVGWMIAPYDPNTIEAGFFDEKPPNDHHRLAILETHYHKVGIGCIIRPSTGAIFSTQDFGS